MSNKLFVLVIVLFHRGVSDSAVENQLAFLV